MGLVRELTCQLFIFSDQNCAMSELTEDSICSSVDFNFPELYLKLLRIYLLGGSIRGFFNII